MVVLPCPAGPFRPSRGGLKRWCRNYHSYLWESICACIIVTYTMMEARKKSYNQKYNEIAGICSILLKHIAKWLEIFEIVMGGWLGRDLENCLFMDFSVLWRSGIKYVFPKQNGIRVNSSFRIDSHQAEQGKCSELPWDYWMALVIFVFWIFIYQSNPKLG